MSSRHEAITNGIAVACALLPVANDAFANVAAEYGKENAMPSPLANTRADLDAIVEEIDRKLEKVYRLSPGKSRAEVWASLTSAALKLAAPEDRTTCTNASTPSSRPRRRGPCWQCPTERTRLALLTIRGHLRTFQQRFAWRSRS